jgi:hypothetical protein
MLRTLSDLHAYTIGAVDGAIGHVKDIYVDDTAWVVRYLVVETGSWLESKKVLISPIAIGKVDWEARQLHVAITKEQVKNCPDVDTEKPITRQHEQDYSGYYGYPYYWGGLGYWGGGMFPEMMLSSYGGANAPQALQFMQQEAENFRASAEGHHDETASSHLRSCAAITGYHLQASDGEIGHVSGALIDDQTWAVRYLIVNTSNWWFGHQILVAPSWIEAISWSEATVSVKLTRDAVKDAPPYDSNQQLSRADEERLHQHYVRAGYWAKS